MEDEKSSPVGGRVIGPAFNVDISEAQAEKLAHELIVIAGNVYDPRPVTRLFQDFLDDRVVRFRPVPAAGECPPIDNIPDEEKRLATGVFEERKHTLGLATPGTEMDIGYPDRAERPRHNGY